MKQTTYYYIQTNKQTRVYTCACVCDKDRQTEILFLYNMCFQLFQHVWGERFVELFWNWISFKLPFPYLRCYEDLLGKETITYSINHFSKQTKWDVCYCQLFLLVICDADLVFIAVIAKWLILLQTMTRTIVSKPSLSEHVMPLEMLSETDESQEFF